MSGGELLLTLVVALIVFGPKKLPMLATHLGQLVRKINHFKEHGSLLWQQQLSQLDLQENTRKAKEADQYYEQIK